MGIQTAHVVILYIPESQRRYIMGTSLGPKYILYTYIGPVGYNYQLQQLHERFRQDMQGPLCIYLYVLRVGLAVFAGRGSLLEATSSAPPPD